MKACQCYFCQCRIFTLIICTRFNKLITSTFFYLPSRTCYAIRSIWSHFFNRHWDLVDHTLEHSPISLLQFGTNVIQLATNWLVWDLDLDWKAFYSVSNERLMMCFARTELELGSARMALVGRWWWEKRSAQTLPLTSSQPWPRPIIFKHANSLARLDLMIRGMLGFQICHCVLPAIEPNNLDIFSAPIAKSVCEKEVVVWKV